MLGTFSGEHRLLACSFRQLAEKLLGKSNLVGRALSGVGKLPTTAAGSLYSPRKARGDGLARVAACAKLLGLPKMFFRKLGHAKLLEPASEHPMVKGITRSELVSLLLVSVCFFELA